VRNAAEILIAEFAKGPFGVKTDNFLERGGSGRINKSHAFKMPIEFSIFTIITQILLQRLLKVDLKKCIGYMKACLIFSYILVTCF
jgi:hypothetical protein